MRDMAPRGRACLPFPRDHEEALHIYNKTYTVHGKKMNIRCHVHANAGLKVSPWSLNTSLQASFSDKPGSNSRWGCRDALPRLALPEHHCWEHWLPSCTDYTEHRWVALNGGSLYMLTCMMNISPVCKALATYKTAWPSGCGLQA